jgi:hypothetical protein
VFIHFPHHPRFSHFLGCVYISRVITFGSSSFHLASLDASHHAYIWWLKAASALTQHVVSFTIVQVRYSMSTLPVTHYPFIGSSIRISSSLLVCFDNIKSRLFYVIPELYLSCTAARVLDCTGVAKSLQEDARLCQWTSMVRERRTGA